MLKNFQFAIYRFTYIVKEPLTMPQYKGNVFRSRLGYILRGISCVGSKGDCEKSCQFPQRCIYSQFFETPIPKGSPVQTGQNFAPHPFVLEPPLTPQAEYHPGENFSCDVILIGIAIDLLPWLIYTFDEMGVRRLGLRGKRGRCQLDLVECLPSLESELSQTIYTGASRTVQDTQLTLTLDDVLKNAPQISSRLTLDFVTPTRIKVGGKIIKQLTFEPFIRSLLRRIYHLAYFHCHEQLDVNVEDLWEKSSGIEAESQLRWEVAKRWSYRGNQQVPMDGLVGQIRFEGDLHPFLPLICLGEYLHVGHNTAFGFGKYRVTP
jgi:CRISPR-associated endoribonuclease Cas6